jgi:hypothetical protein
MNLVYGFRRFITIALLIVLLAFCTVASAQPGRLDFLKAKDSSFALFANTSNTQSLTWSGPYYKNELILLTGLPSNPTISARIDLLGGTYVCAGCGGIRNVAISPDGDTALLSSEPSVTYTSTAPRAESILFLLRNLRAFAHSKDPGDLSIRRLKASEFPQLDNVAGIAFGPDGQWAVVTRLSHHKSNRLSWLEGSSKDIRPSALEITCKIGVFSKRVMLRIWRSL